MTNDTHRTRRNAKIVFEGTIQKQMLRLRVHGVAMGSEAQS